MGKKIFISYRRDDSQYQVDDLYEVLMKHNVKKEDVFKDIESIQIGQNFEQAIDDALEQSDMVFVVIGKNWFNADNKARLNDENDYVRREIAKALQHERVLTIPILYDAPMPPANELPDDLKELTLRNAFEITRKYKDQDIQELVDKLELGKNETREKKIEAVVNTSKKAFSIVKWVVIAAVVMAIAIPAIVMNMGNDKLANAEPAVQAAFEWEDRSAVYLFKDTYYDKYDVPSNMYLEGYPAIVDGNWVGLSYTGYFDAAVEWEELDAVYFFHGDTYSKWILSQATGAGNEKPIAGNWEGVWEADIDAAFKSNIDNAIYFIKGREIRLYDLTAQKVIDGTSNLEYALPGLPWDIVDAAVNIKSTKTVAFFKGELYLLYDLENQMVIKEPSSMDNFSLY